MTGTSAVIVRAKPNPSFIGAVLVNVVCPHCEHEHAHGVPAVDAGLPGPDYGHRIAHCGRGSGSYTLHDRHGLVPAAMREC